MGTRGPADPGIALKKLMAGHSVTKVARHLHMAGGTLTRLLKGKPRLKAEMALRLSEAFGVDAMVWMEMQMKLDVWVAKRKKRKKIKSLVVGRRASWQFGD